MRLTITNVHRTDYGSYKCVAKNPRGEMDGTIKLYMSSPPTTIPPPTTTSLTTTYSTTEWDESDEFNAFGPTHSVVLIDKLGYKYHSNLNEIDKSEQKFNGDTSKTFDWTHDKPNSLVATLSPHSYGRLSATMILFWWWWWSTSSSWSFLWSLLISLTWSRT